MLSYISSFLPTIFKTKIFTVTIGFGCGSTSTCSTLASSSIGCAFIPTHTPTYDRLSTRIADSPIAVVIGIGIGATADPTSTMKLFYIAQNRVLSSALSLDLGGVS